MKIVLDTNVLVSAFFWKGNERSILEACIDGEHELATSIFILEELTRVLHDKFEVPPPKVAAYVGQLIAHATVVDPVPHLEVIQEDPSDNRILECAKATQADAIVSGDTHLRELKQFDEVTIHKAADLV